MVKKGFIDKDLLDRDRVTAEIKNLAARKGWSITETCHKLGEKSNGFHASFKKGQRNMREEALDNLCKMTKSFKSDFYKSTARQSTVAEEDKESKYWVLLHMFMPWRGQYEWFMSDKKLTRGQVREIERATDFSWNLLPYGIADAGALHFVVTVELFQRKADAIREYRAVQRGEDPIAAKILEECFEEDNDGMDKRKR